MLKENRICLERDKGLKINGNEEKIRSVLVSILNSDSQVSEILTGEIGKNKVLSLIPMESYEQSRKVFSEIRLPEMTDRTKAMMHLFFTTSLLRLHQKNTVSTDNLERPSKASLKFVNQLVSKIDNIVFTISEITYLSVVYDVLYFGFGRDILFMEKFDSNLSYIIRKLIDNVSNDLESNLVRTTKYMDCSIHI